MRKIYLLHGTFAGADASGFLAELGRFFPAAQERLAGQAKSLIDAVMTDNGNYTGELARQFEDAFRSCAEPAVSVTIFPWSGENHHLGRADAAVRLLKELASLKLPAGGRVLIWAHSHAGNVLALLTHLLAGNPAAIDAFFSAASCYYRVPWLGCVDIPVWDEVEKMLRAGPPPLVRHPLDIVTFGTPIRYGWNAAGHAKLLHFIHHRPSPGTAPFLTALPQTFEEVLGAKFGDYVQQLGIAGTNVSPAITAWRAWLADRRLNRLLQPAEFTALNVVARIRVGLRAPEAGQTLLVDYGLPTERIERHFAGHAVYTRLDWLPFHAAETARQLYADAGDTNIR